MSRYAIKEADFKLFTVLWNQRMGQSTPAIHFKMADWLEWRWKKKDLRLLLQAFRSSGKSTIVGLFAAWLLYRDPNLRILVVAADHNLARKMVRNVRRIIERHPLTKNLIPPNADQWAGERFTVKRMLELRDPSMSAKGITSNLTGSRADVIICDDVEVPNTCDTTEKRRELRARLSEIDYVLVPDGTQLYVGTPHSYYTIYAEKERQEIGESRAFLENFLRLTIPVLDSKNESVWPERFSGAVLDHMRRHSGPNKFASQMMLKPVNIAEGRLDPSLLVIYDDALDYTKELQTLFIGDTKIVSASAWWDPAFGSARGDRSVCAAVFADAEGNYYLHQLLYIKNESSPQEDEATHQCRAIAHMAQEFYLPSVTVETNGIGKFLPTILRNEMAKAKAPCAVLESNATRSKDLRILEAFDAVLAARRLRVHRSVLQTPFMAEMQEWRPGTGRGHDDGLDAVAGALGQQPVRLKRLYGQGTQNWMQNSQSQKAKTEFEV